MVCLDSHACTDCVQRIRATVDTEERKRLLMDLNVSMMAKSCPYTVTFYGALFREVRPHTTHTLTPHTTHREMCSYVWSSWTSLYVSCMIWCMAHSTLPYLSLSLGL